MGKTYYYISQSPAAFINEAAQLKPNMLVNFSVGYSIFKDCTYSRDGEFHGSWAKTLRTLKESSFAATASLTDQIIDEINTVEFHEVQWKFLTHLEEGDEVDVDRYIAGYERCWNGVRRRRKFRHSVRIYINFGGNAFRSERELAVAGAVGVTFAEIMESMGLSAEIWAVHCSTCIDCAGNHIVNLVKLKSQHEYADMGLINWFLGNDGVFRNALFRQHILASIKKGIDVMPGLGHSQTIGLDEIGLTESEKRSAIIVPSLFSSDGAKKWLSEALSDQELLHRIIYQEDDIINQ